MRILHTIRPGAIRLLLGLAALPACQAFEWNGSAGSDFRSLASWMGKHPTANSFNAGDLIIANAQNAPLVHSDTDGKPVFQGADFKVGSLPNHGGLKITGGELTGGLLVVASRHGTAFQPLNGRGVGILTIGEGDGVFMRTDSKQITFGEGGGTASYIDFHSGSRGQLSLNEAAEEDYVAWVRAGKIRLNGQPTSPDKFRFIHLPPQGIYLLATP